MCYLLRLLWLAPLQVSTGWAGSVDRSVFFPPPIPVPQTLPLGWDEKPHRLVLVGGRARVHT